MSDRPGSIIGRIPSTKAGRSRGSDRRRRIRSRHHPRNWSSPSCRKSGSRRSRCGWRDPRDCWLAAAKPLEFLEDVRVHVGEQLLGELHFLFGEACRLTAKLAALGIVRNLLAAAVQRMVFPYPLEMLEPNASLSPANNEVQHGTPGAGQMRGLRLTTVPLERCAYDRRRRIGRTNSPVVGRCERDLKMDLSEYFQPPLDRLRFTAIGGRTGPAATAGKTSQGQAETAREGQEKKSQAAT